MTRPVVVDGPVVMQTPARKAMGMNGPVDVPEGIVVLVRYKLSTPEQLHSPDPPILECDCPRVVTATHLLVWHSAECPELAHA